MGWIQLDETLKKVKELNQQLEKLKVLSEELLVSDEESQEMYPIGQITFNDEKEAEISTNKNIN